ncbi:hypothetical protein [Ruegeria hyattellae]|uniref:hypothetical protein n=1 Tax=Ruegeria hyattellae TaxID=3233337 RepID=UPI00355B530D
MAKIIPDAVISLRYGLCSDVIECPFVVALFAAVPDHLIGATFPVVLALFISFPHGIADDRPAFLAENDIAG